MPQGNRASFIMAHREKALCLSQVSTVSCEKVVVSYENTIKKVVSYLVETTIKPIYLFYLPGNNFKMSLSPLIWKCQKLKAKSKV